jgi:hypothetical protein
LSERRSIGSAHPLFEEHPMLDPILLLLGLGFFVLAVGYTIACDRL